MVPLLDTVAFALFAVLPPQTVADVDLIDFETEEQPFLLATLDGSPTLGSLGRNLQAVGVHDGLASLEYSYAQSDPVELVACPSLMTDLQDLQLWIKSERTIFWALYHTDRDGAVFENTVLLPAGQWVFLDLQPADFSLSATSPVTKPAMEPERNGFAWVGFDVAATLPFGGPNKIWIDTYSLQREDMNAMAGPVIVPPGLPVTITAPTRIDGDVIVLPGGSFSSTASRLNVAGNLTSFGVGADLTISEGVLRLESAYRHQRQLIVSRQGRLGLQNLLFMPGSMCDVATDLGGFLDVADCDFAAGAMSVGIQDGGICHLTDCTMPGEIIVNEGSELVATNVDSMLIWLLAGAGLNANLVLPTATDLTWSLDPTWNRQLDLVNVGDPMFGLLVGEQCNLLVQDSNFLAVGVILETMDANLVDYQNSETIIGTTFPWPNRNVRFENTSIGAWNFYTMGTTRLTLRDSLFGEVLTFEDSRADILDSVCDGSGGYLGSRDNSTLVMRRSDALCDVIATDQSRLGIVNGTVTGPITAADDAVLGLISCTILGPMIELGNGWIVVR